MSGNYRTRGSNDQMRINQLMDAVQNSGGNISNEEIAQIWNIPIQRVEEVMDRLTVMYNLPITRRIKKVVYQFDSYQGYDPAAQMGSIPSSPGYSPPYQDRSVPVNPKYSTSSSNYQPSGTQPSQPPQSSSGPSPSPRPDPSPSPQSREEPKSFCPGCGTAAKPNDRFCGICGHDMQSAK